MDYLFDTTSFIDYYRGRPIGRQYIQRVLSGDDTGAFSTITEAELWVGERFRGLGQEERRTYEELLRLMQRIPVTRRVAHEAARIRRDKRLKLNDAIIAASAVVTGRKIVTRDADFSRLDSSLVEMLI